MAQRHTTKDDGEWWRIEARHLCAGLHVDADGYVDRAAPILNWTRGKKLEYVQRYCREKRWKIERLERNAQ